jgi:hypothetical protein
MQRRRVFLAGLSIFLQLVVVWGLLSLLGRPVHAADCTVTSTLDSGPGSLRACMAQLGAGDVVTFDTAVFPPGNPQTIVLNSALPTIVTNTMTIDGSNAGVILDGSGTPEGTRGLVIDGASNVLIKGLQILNFPSDGIVLQNGASNNTIGGTNATPGGACSGDCNLISGNGTEGGSAGVNIQGSDTMNNTVSGNYIGTDASGTLALGNIRRGVMISDAQWNIIGGDTPGERNLISGNNPGCVFDSAMIIHDYGAMNNTVKGNYIGTDASGTSALPNCAAVDIRSEASYNIISDNLISGNEGIGVTIRSDAMHNTIIGNKIGTDVNGTSALPNGRGFRIAEGAQYNVIGGDTPGERNIISGNRTCGVLIAHSDPSWGPSMNNTVSGNYIGTDIYGTSPIGNVESGITIGWYAQYNIIGGATPGERNIISGNGGDGVLIMGTLAISNTISGNYIGTDASGIVALPNADDGIEITDGASYNVIGGATPGEGNVISGNGNDGVFIFGMGNATINNTITQNSIYGHPGKGIELSDGGNLELFPPLLTNITADTVTGIAVPNSTVEVFSDNEDEGQAFEGSTTADGSGNFTFNQPGGFTLSNVTATATDSDGNTSEFSSAYAPKHDVALQYIYSPKAKEKVSEPITPTVKVGNAGTNVETAIAVTSWITDNTTSSLVYSDTQTIATLPSLASTVVTFEPWTPPFARTYLFRAAVQLAGDEDSTNDAKEVTTTVVDERVDVFARDCEADTGEICGQDGYKCAGDWWMSPDVWVRNQQDGGERDQEVIAGQTNYVYGRVHNIGDVAIVSTTVRVYWHDFAASIECPDWSYIGSNVVNNLEPSEQRVVVIPWSVPATAEGHNCLMVRLVTTQDPIINDCDPPCDNNIGHHNIEIVPGFVQPLGVGAQSTADVDFEVINVRSKLASVDLVIGRGNFPTTGTLTLDLGDQFFSRWETVTGGGSDNLDGAEEAGGSTIRITGAVSGTIFGLPMYAGESQGVTMTLDGPSGVDFTVSVMERIDGEIMGGVSFVAAPPWENYLPIILKSYSGP